MLRYTIPGTSTTHTATELRDAATFEAADALENGGSDPGRRAADSLCCDFNVAVNDITLAPSVNGEPGTITIRCNPGEIVLTWDPMQDGYDCGDEDEDEDEQPAERQLIRIDPTWSSMVGILVSLIEQGGESRRLAVEQLTALAKFADQVNEATRNTP